MQKRQKMCKNIYVLYMAGGEKEGKNNRAANDKQKQLKRR